MSIRPDTLELFLKNFTRHALDKHQLIVRADQQPTGVYYLKRGYVRAFTLSADGREFTIIIHKPGDCFPIWWILNEQLSNRFFFETMTRAQLWSTPRKEFLKFLNEHPNVFSELVQEVAVRLTGLITRIENLVFSSAYAKVASILVICAERFGKKHHQTITIQVPLRHIDIANLVGIARETASLELKKLHRAGLISRRARCLIIRDIKKLKRAAAIY